MSKRKISVHGFVRERVERNVRPSQEARQIAYDRGGIINRLFAVLQTAFAVVSLFACADVAHAQSALPPDDASFYAYDASAPFSVTETPLASQDGLRVSRITYPSLVTSPYVINNTVTAYLFLPPGPGPYPAMTVMHEWNPSSTESGFQLCRVIAKAHVAALMIVEPYSLNRKVNAPNADDAHILSGNVPQMVGSLRQAVLDTRRGLDWLCQRSDIDPQRLGVSGISLGGVLSGVVAEVDPRVKVVMTLVAGADFARGFWNGLLTRKYRAQIQRDGYTFETFHTAMAPIDAQRWQRPFDPKNALLFDGRYDLVIPADEAYRLSEALGGTHIIWANTGHYGMRFSIKQAGDIADAFLRARFFGEESGFHPPGTLRSRTIKGGLLLGGDEIISPVLAYQVLDFDEPGRFSLDGQLTYRGLSAALSARINPIASVGMEFPLLHGKIKPRPYVMLSITL